MVQSIIEIYEYDKEWEEIFSSLKEVVIHSLGHLILDIEHVGSTAVPGLGAKPILDIDVVIQDHDVLPDVIQELEILGYHHQPEWSFEGREAFGRKDLLTPWDGSKTEWMDHHLYVCNKESEELSRHIAFRNYLRNNRAAVMKYDKLKRTLAKEMNNRAAYTSGKTEFINKVLEKTKG
ncbi:GrpB family protein [Bacillus spongiae]|uniref:GrpB family protein n=1 Tax=Bacillus spongiae TaxID=2683610 RepID=A0ABU8HKE5_9BACI